MPLGPGAAEPTQEGTIHLSEPTCWRSLAMVAVCAGVSALACALLLIELRRCRAELDQAIFDRNACLGVIERSLDEMFEGGEMARVPELNSTVAF